VRMLSDLGAIENVTLTTMDDDGEHVQITWNPEESMA
jgi:hypothetical protein